MMFTNRMKRHEPQILTAAYLQNWIAEHEDTEAHDFSDIENASATEWFVVQYPDHCVTCQNLGDASIHGPFQSEEAATEYAS